MFRFSTAATVSSGKAVDERDGTMSKLALMFWPKTRGRPPWRC